MTQKTRILGKLFTPIFSFGSPYLGNGLRLQNFMWNQSQESTKLCKSFSRIGQAIRHLIGSRLSTRIIYFSITIVGRGLKFYVHKSRVMIFIVYKFRKNRITKGGEKENLFYLRIQLDHEIRLGKLAYLIFITPDYKSHFRQDFRLACFHFILLNLSFK